MVPLGSFLLVRLRILLTYCSISGKVDPLQHRVSRLIPCFRSMHLYQLASHTFEYMMILKKNTVSTRTWMVWIEGRTPFIYGDDRRGHGCLCSIRVSTMAQLQIRIVICNPIHSPKIIAGWSSWDCLPFVSSTSASHDLKVQCMSLSS